MVISHCSCYHQCHQTRQYSRRLMPYLTRYKLKCSSSNKTRSNMDYVARAVRLVFSAENRRYMSAAAAAAAIMYCWVRAQKRVQLAVAISHTKAGTAMRIGARYMTIVIGPAPRRLLSSTTMHAASAVLNGSAESAERVQTCRPAAPIM